MFFALDKCFGKKQFSFYLVIKKPLSLAYSARDKGYIIISFCGTTLIGIFIPTLYVLSYVSVLITEQFPLASTLFRFQATLQGPFNTVAMLPRTIRQLSEKASIPTISLSSVYFIGLKYKSFIWFCQLIYFYFLVVIY